jgi:hypothetical protein
MTRELYPPCQAGEGYRLSLGGDCGQTQDLGDVVDFDAVSALDLYGWQPSIKD